MEWLTISQIKRGSKTAKGALKASYEHWCQLYDATAKELRRELKKIGILFLIQTVVYVSITVIKICKIETAPVVSLVIIVPNQNQLLCGEMRARPERLTNGHQRLRTSFIRNVDYWSHRKN